MPGSKAAVLLSGVSTHHKMLYPGRCYYASATGSISLHPSEIPMGFSVSENELLLFAPGCRSAAH